MCPQFIGIAQWTQRYNATCVHQSAQPVWNFNATTVYCSLNYFVQAKPKNSPERSSGNLVQQPSLLYTVSGLYVVDFTRANTMITINDPSVYCLSIAWFLSFDTSLNFIFVYYVLLHFAWVVDDAKCIVLRRVCVSVGVSVWLSAAACLQYWMEPGITWGTGRVCPLVVQHWADLQSVHGLRCYGNITRTVDTILPSSLI